MATVLDSKLPTSESVVAFLDQNNNKEVSEGTQTDSHAVLDEEKLKKAVDEKRTKFEHASRYNRELDNNEFSVEEIMKFEELRLSIAEKELVEQLVAVEKQLESPSENTSELVRALREFTEISSDLSAPIESQELAKSGELLIKNRWFDGELKARLDQSKQVLTSAKWPREMSLNSDTIKNSSSMCFESSVSDTFATLARPIGDRIIFNFQQTRDTARPDKPEWLFQYVEKLSKTQRLWVSSVLQQFVDEPMDHLVRAMSPFFVETCHKTYVINSHFVGELLDIVNTLESTFSCCPETTEDSLNQVLTPQFLDKYIDSEEQAQLKAAKSLIATGSQAIDYDVDHPCAKPTFLAVNVRQMLDENDYLLRLDPKAVSKRVHFSIITVFFNSLDVKLESYDRAHSSSARAVGTMDSESLDKKVRLGDVNDAEYLARIFGSASFFVLVLERMSVDLVVASVPEIGDEINKFARLFENLRDRSGERSSKSSLRDVQRALKDYFRVNWQHNSLSSRTIMRSAIDSLHSSIDFMGKFCASSKADRARISISLAQALAKMFWRMVIQANVFTPSAAAQLRSDIEFIWSALNLPQIAEHFANMEATQVLEHGKDAEIGELTEDQIDGLSRRRV